MTMPDFSCMQSKPVLPEHRAYADVLNNSVGALAQAVKTNQQTDHLELQLMEQLAATGVRFPRSDFSLVVYLDWAQIPELAREVITKWGSQEELCRIPLAPPLKETTGMHGSGEREKLAESVSTVSLDWDKRGVPEFSFDLWGRYSGLYHKLRNALSFKVPIQAVVSFEIDSSIQWVGMLARAAESVYQNKASARWPDFVANQVKMLSELSTDKTGG